MGLGTIALQLGMVEFGVQCLERASEISPGNSMMLGNLASGLEQLGRIDQALAVYAHAIKLDPKRAESYVNRGVLFQELGRNSEALADYELALKLKPKFPEVYNNRGNVLKALGRFDDALASYDQAIKLKPDYAAAFGNRGIVLQDLNRLEEALADYNKAIILKPDFTKAYNNRGAVLRDLGELDRALADVDRAIAMNPDFAEAHCNRGSVLKKLKQYDAALKSLDHAILLRPGLAEAYINRGNVMQELKQLGAALENYERAIKLDSMNAEGYNNRGNVLKDLQRLDEALASYERAIEIQPDYPTAHWNIAFLKILTGDYEQGWRLYEWRWKDALRNAVREFHQPLWLGEQEIVGKTLLIHAEQGLGDVIQFCRYAAMAVARGASVVMEVQPSLVSLLSTLGMGVRVIGRGEVLPDFDYHCPIMSLPLAFRTTLKNIPATIPYLHVDVEKENVWNERLGRKIKPRIGLVWSGRFDHTNDYNRSIPFRLLAPLLELPVEFHVLQQEIRAEDAADVAACPALRGHKEALQDFSDTAALVQLMDIVVTVDTSVAHLAGALGKPVWIMLPYAPDYRWMLNRSDSPWYPSASLFRQPAIGDWESVILNIAEELPAAIMP
jgi:tetratricopeptide (TPR) repeat protein